MSEPTRTYRKRKRALAEERTRQRITEAAVELHRTVGPANTTITDIAELAGVSRATVYNHFPSDVELFTACSSHWAARNPFPDPASWSAPDPEERLRGALEELYEWYGRGRHMLGNVLGDMPNVPALADVMEGLWAPWVEAVVQALAEGWCSPDDDTFHAVLRVAVDFNTWCILADSELDESAAASLMARLVSCLGET
ncbi:MAG: TetR/AcrR family transcriptional regulator [Gemmatimonadota bacterium]|jgi:AcrR family transcriptional regulator